MIKNNSESATPTANLMQGQNKDFFFFLVN